MNVELEALEAAASAADSETQTSTSDPLPAPDLPQGPDYHVEARSIVFMFASLVKGYCPETETIWTENTKYDVAAALAPTLQYFGWTMGAMPPWVITLFVAGPPIYQTAMMVRQKMDEKKPEPVQPGIEAEIGTESRPEPLVHDQVKLYANGR